MEVRERFLSKLEKTDTCWLWKASKTPRGYGNFWMDRDNWRAHRCAYILFKGPISNHLMVCHTCHNPSCVNPDHLYLGTHSDNMKDRSDADRCRRTRFSEQQLLAIKQDPRGQRVLAKEYGTTQSHIWRIRHDLIRH